MVSTERGIDRINEGIQTFLRGKHKRQVQEAEAQLQVSIFSILCSRNFPFGQKWLQTWAATVPAPGLAAPGLSTARAALFFPCGPEFLPVRGNIFHITGFMNCVIDFICKADLPVCYIFLFDRSFLKGEKKRSKPKQMEKKANQQTLLLWVKFSIDSVPLGITWKKQRIFPSPDFEKS